MNHKTMRAVLAPLLIWSGVYAQNAEKEALSSAAQGEAAEKVSYGPGIDTLDVESGGNWLQKRVIWEDAQRKYEKIQAMEHDVLESRVVLFEKRSSSDKSLNVFYSTVGFDQGEIDEIIDTLLESLEKMKEKGTLTDQEKAIQAKLYEHKNELEQVKADVKTLTEYDAALDSAVMQLVNQVTLAGNYERQAWQKFKDIGQELDDRKAKEYYLEMDALAKNIEAIGGYIKGSLADYVTKVTTKIDELTGTVKSELEDLRKSGIELKNQIAELDQAAVQEPEKPQKKKTTWFDTVAVVWRYPLSLMTRLWGFVTSLIWGAKK